MKIRHITSTLLLLLSCAAQAFTLVADGRPSCSLRLSSQASAPEQYAGRELTSYVKKITGTVLPQGAGEQEILLGTTSSLSGLPEIITRKLNSASSNDAFYILVSGKKLYLIGRKPQGALYAVYTLLEKYFGVRWFYPGELGEDILPAKTLRLQTADDCQSPDFKYRKFSVCGTSSNFISTYDWMVRHKMQIPAYNWQLAGMTGKQKEIYRAERAAFDTVGGHHIFRSIIPASMIKTHPEYFALQKGKRRSTGRVNRCLSNPDVIRLTAEYMIRKVDENPDVLIQFIGEDAMDAFCECEGCKAMSTYQGHESISNLFHNFFSRVSAIILKARPKANISYWAYWNYRKLPDDPALRYDAPNSYLMYALHQRCYNHRLAEDVSCNRPFYQEMMNWRKRSAHLGIYDYRHDAHCFYAPFEYILGDDFKLFHRLGVVAWADEVQTGEGATGEEAYVKDKFRANWQCHYLAAQMLWDASLDPEKLLSDTYDRYYGKAAPVMKEYHAMRLRLWNAAPGHTYLNGPERTAYCLNVPGAEKQLTALLDKADRLADTDKTRKRIGEDRRFLETFWAAPCRELQKRLSQTKELVPVPVDDKITIDGKFNENTWLKAPVGTGFLLRSKEIPRENTNVRLAYDNDNLYIAVNADDSKSYSPAKAECSQHDGQVWGDDSIEIQLAPPGDSDMYYHIIINTRGVIYDASLIGQNATRKYESGAEVKVLHQDRNFQYEIRLPLAPMKVRFDSRPWKMHFMRTAHNLMPPTITEWSAMDGIPPFHPELFRKVTFGKNYIANGNFSEMREINAGSGKKIPFPKYWETAGSTLTRHQFIKTASGHQIKYSGLIFTGFHVPKDQKGNYIFTIRAKGTGQISCSTWSWEGYSPRTNHRRENLQKYPLTDQFKDYVFTCRYLPKEYHFILYIHGKDITIENASAILK